MDEIVKLLWSRNEKAITLMQTQYGSFCRYILSGFLWNDLDIEEALSDIWFRVWNSIPPAKPAYLKAYLAKTARNTALHYVERENAQKRKGITILLDELAECIPDSEASSRMDAHELKALLNTFVRSLTVEERSYFIRRYYFGENIRQIAIAHKSTENSVTVALYRIRKKLRVLLEREGYEI